jgi:hypothetical protein
MKKWNKPELMTAEISSTEHGFPNCYTDGCFLGIPTHGPVNPNPDPDPVDPTPDPDPVDPDPGTDPLS